MIIIGQILAVVSIIIISALITTLSAWLFREDSKAEKGLPHFKYANLFTACLTFGIASILMSLIMPLIPALIIAGAAEIAGLWSGEKFKHPTE